LPVIALRVFAAYDLLRRPPSKRAQPRIPDAELPVYTILVPLYREANMLASLVRALARLDYPAAKIDIKLILKRSTSRRSPWRGDSISPAMSRSW
jgi:glycosyltransferase XagB